MTKEQFLTEGKTISEQAELMDSFHGYFIDSAPRLHLSCEQFGLFEGSLGDVLEVGPFFGYIPFLLRNRATSYTVLEGNDPACYPLLPLYKKADIGISCVDFFDIFGPVRGATQRLPFPEASFDKIICWETMEHFNFNPVKLVRELLRVLKPGGQVMITVPNRASFQNLFNQVFGRMELHSINDYYTFENYVSDGKNAFYGFHWREYTKNELFRLFSKAGFEVPKSGTLTVFHDNGKHGPVRLIARKLMQLVTQLLPRYSTHVYMLANKPK